MYLLTVDSCSKDRELSVSKIMDFEKSYVILYDESRFSLLFYSFDCLIVLYSRILKKKMVYTNVLDNMFNNLFYLRGNLSFLKRCIVFLF